MQHTKRDITVLYVEPVCQLTVPKKRTVVVNEIGVGKRAVDDEINPLPLLTVVSMLILVTMYQVSLPVSSTKNTGSPTSYALRRQQKRKQNKWRQTRTERANDLLVHVGAR